MSRKFRGQASIGALAAAALIGACGGGSSVTTATVTAKDYAFENLPSSVKVGSTLKLKNESTKELHELVVMRIPDDEKRSAADLVKLPKAEADKIFVGRPATVLLAPPGGGAVINAVGDGRLAEKGRYAVICAIPTGVDPAAYLAAVKAATNGPPAVAGGPPHFTKGMFGQITVK